MLGWFFRSDSRIETECLMRSLLKSFLAGMVGGVVGLALLLPVVRKERTASCPNPSMVAPSPRPVALRINVPPALAAEGICDFSVAAARALPAVVSITARYGREEERSDIFQWFRNPFFGPEEGKGSGVIYRSDGYVLTNNHVVEGAAEVWVTLQDNRSYLAEVVGTYAPADLAVLKIDATDLPVLPLADSDAARVGAWVLAVGNPLELGATVTAGIISAKGRDIDIIEDNHAIESFIQTDAVVNPGNSGGALVDAEGRLLGINTAIATTTGFYEGYSFAIPINLARKIADDIIAWGSYQRGFLGINITELDDELAERLGLNITRGLVVTGVVPGSAAEDAGIRLNDVIVAVDGKPVASAPALLEYVGRARIGQTLNLTLDRHGKKLQIAVVLRGVE